MFVVPLLSLVPSHFPLKNHLGQIFVRVERRCKRRLRIFMAAIPLCLLLNKPLLFSLTQRRCILIQIVTCACVLHVIKSGDCQQGTPLDSYYILHCKVVVLPCLRMAQIQAEACSTHENVTIWIKVNLYCVWLNKCNLFRRLRSPIWITSLWNATSELCPRTEHALSCLHLQ